MLLEVTRKSIDDSADFGCPNVIAFTGFSENFSPEEGARIAFQDLRKLPHAEKKE